MNDKTKFKCRLSNHRWLRVTIMSGIALSIVIILVALILPRFQPQDPTGRPQQPVMAGLLRR